MGPMQANSQSSTSDMKTRSSNYALTVNNNAAGHEAINDLRHKAKIFNAEERLKELTTPGYARKIQKVALYGRLGKNNPSAYKYKPARFSWRNPYSRIRLEDAATIDVYVNMYQQVTYPHWSGNERMIKGIRSIY